MKRWTLVGLEKSAVTVSACELFDTSDAKRRYVTDLFTFAYSMLLTAISSSSLAQIVPASHFCVLRHVTLQCNAFHYSTTRLKYAPKVSTFFTHLSTRTQNSYL